MFSDYLVCIYMEIITVLTLLKWIFITFCGNGIQAQETSDFSLTVKKPNFLDKTLLIRDFLCHGDKIIQLTAPDGFGKSTNTDMLKRFLEIENCDLHANKNSSNYKTFKDNNLQIAQDEGLFDKHFGKHPVLRIDYDRLGQIDDDNVLEVMTKIVKDSFESFSCLLRVENFWPNEFEKETFKNYLTQKLNSAQIEKSFEYLCSVLHRYYNKNIFVLIDNYDSLKRLIFKNTDLNKTISLLRSVNMFLGNAEVEKAFITGALELGAGLLPNGTVQYRFLRNHMFNAYFGMTEPELNRILWNDEEKDKIKDAVDAYYGGYETEKKNKKMYNIPVVLRFLQTRTWSVMVRSESEGLECKRVCRVKKIAYQMKMLLLGYHVDVDISSPLTAEDVLRSSQLATTLKASDNEDLNLFMHLLYAEGCLTVVTDGEAADYTSVNLVIPNQDMFARMTGLLETC